MTDKALRMADLLDRFGVTRWTIQRWMRELDFPKGVKPLRGKGLVWSEAAVTEWDKRSLLSIGRVNAE